MASSIYLIELQQILTKYFRGFEKDLVKRRKNGRFSTKQLIYLNPIRLKWMPIWHPLPFSLYLRHGFCSEDAEANRVKYPLQTPSKALGEYLSQHYNLMLVYNSLGRVDNVTFYFTTKSGSLQYQ